MKHRGKWNGNPSILKSLPEGKINLGDSIPLIIQHTHVHFHVRWWEHENKVSTTFPDIFTTPRTVSYIADI